MFKCHDAQLNIMAKGLALTAACKTFWTLKSALSHMSITPQNENGVVNSIRIKGRKPRIFRSTQCCALQCHYLKSVRCLLRKSTWSVFKREFVEIFMLALQYKCNTQTKEWLRRQTRVSWEWRHHHIQEEATWVITIILPQKSESSQGFCCRKGTAYAK